MWIDEVEKELKQIYGPINGGFVAHTIIPSFITDYKRMLDEASVGETVEEVYQTEDKKAQIKLVATVDKGPSGEEHRLLSVSVNNRDLEIAPGEKLP